MARHSHWAQIKLKKGAEDKKRGKIFSKHAHFIAVAAKTGGDPNMNPALRAAIENARADLMPRDNIDRAIKKGTGELKGGAEMQEVIYEGYGPAGIALIIEALTDNKNRTGQMVRRILEDHGGRLGTTGSTMHLFERKGVIIVVARGAAAEDELEIIDAGAQDIEAGEGNYIVYTVPTDLRRVRKNLEERGFKIESSQMEFVSGSLVEISDAAAAAQASGLMEALDENNDIVNVSANFAPLSN